MSARRLAGTLLLVKQLTSAASQSAEKTVFNVQTAVAASLLREVTNRSSGSCTSNHASCRGIHSIGSHRLHSPHPYASSQSSAAWENSTRANEQPDRYQTQYSNSWTENEASYSPLNAPQGRAAESFKAKTFRLVNEAKQLSRAGAMPELVQLFQENPILQRTEQFNDVLGSLPSSCCDLVPIVYDELVGKVGIRPDYLSVAKKLRALSRMKRNAEAKALWQGWLADGNPLHANLVAAYSHVLANGREAEAIEALVEEAKAAGLEPVKAAYSALIRAWGMRKQLVNVRQVLRDMKEDGLAPNELHYRGAIAAHGFAQRTREAEYMLTEMKEAGIIPGAESYFAFLEGFAMAKQPRRASQIMQDFVDNGGEPTLEMCNTLIKGWAKTGEPGEVRAVMLNMRNEGLQPDVQSWAGLVHAYAIAQQPGKAAEAVREMRQAGLPLGVVIYTSLLNAYARAGDVAAAQQVLQDMKAAGVKPNNHTYSSLMAAHSQLGDVSSVMALQADMKKQGLRMDAVTQLFLVEAAMESWSRSGRPLSVLPQAESMFEQCSSLNSHQMHFGDTREWHKVFLDLHGYGHWGCQLALVAGIRKLYDLYCTPGSSWPDSDFVVNVGKGTNSIHGHDAPVRDVVLHFLQHLVPVKLAARNDGLITVRRVDMLKMFKTMQAQQMPCDASTFHDCFTASQQESGHLQDLMKRL